MLKGKKVSVVLPAFNEEEGLPLVVKKMPSFVDRVFVVDNNSTDATAAVARKLGCEVLFEGRKGKGNAFRRFQSQAEMGEDSIVVMLDSDNTYDASEMENLISPLFDGFDVVMGDRIKGRREGGSLGGLKLFGDIFLTSVARILYFSSIGDLCTGYWAFRFSALKKLKITAEGFDLEADLFSQASKNNLKIKSVPIKYSKRAGAAKLRLVHGFAILGRLLTNRI